MERGSVRRSSLTKDERGPSSVRRTLELFEIQRCGNFWETGWSAYGLFRAHRYYLELNWTVTTKSWCCCVLKFNIRTGILPLQLIHSRFIQLFQILFKHNKRCMSWIIVNENLTCDWVNLRCFWCIETSWYCLCLELILNLTYVLCRTLLLPGCWIQARNYLHAFLAGLSDVSKQTDPCIYLQFICRILCSQRERILQDINVSRPTVH